MTEEPVTKRPRHRKIDVFAPFTKPFATYSFFAEFNRHLGPEELHGMLDSITSDFDMTSTFRQSRMQKYRPSNPAGKRVYLQPVFEYLFDNGNMDIAVKGIPSNPMYVPKGSELYSGIRFYRRPDQIFANYNESTNRFAISVKRIISERLKPVPL